MAREKTSGSFKEGEKRAKDAGKKGKRGVSMKKSLLRILELEPSTQNIKELEEKLGVEISATQIADLLNATLVKEALAGSIPALKEISDRIDGRVKEFVKISGEIKSRIVLEK